MSMSLRHSARWLFRTLGVLAFALVALFGSVGQASAHDDDDEVVTYGPNVCTAVADLPVYQPATCVKRESELDDGVTEVEQTYVAQASADTVRIFFEEIFRQNGWTVVKAKHDPRDGEWSYTLAKDGRRVKVEVEAQEPYRGSGAEFSITEK
jgi:hypothetical protein